MFLAMLVASIYTDWAVGRSLNDVMGLVRENMERSWSFIQQGLDNKEREGFTHISPMKSSKNHQDSSFQLFVGVFGVVGNTSGIIWFSRKLIQKNFHQLMLCLALCDLLYVILNILLFGVPSIFKHITTTSYYNHMVGSTKKITDLICCRFHGHGYSHGSSWFWC